MRLSRGFALAGGAALVAGTVLGGTGVADAKPIDKGTFHDEFSEIVEDLCDVPGLTAQLDTVVDGRFLVNTRGRDGLAYFTDRADVTDVFTILATGEQFTVKTRTNANDLKVTDNGDGTLTILVLATGNEVLFGPDGKALARNPGQVRFEILVDHGGTPADPSDDEFLEFLGFVKDSTGRNDDFCEGAA